jgi:hypothetical protein
MSDKKFNIDQPDLPEDRINKHKDFKKLMYNYHSATKPIYKTPLYKNKKVFLIILLILLIMFLIVEGLDKEKEQTPDPVNTDQSK